MIQHVYERACLANCAERVIVATDDRRIAGAVEGFGGEAVMTSPDHPSGTARIIEVAKSIKMDSYINVQGDEPLIRPEDIEKVADALGKDKDCKVATLCHPIKAEEAENPNAVKVIVSHDGNALYFSRSPIPFGRERKAHSSYLKHVGIYGYRSDVLHRYNALPKSELEDLEKLEQLRLLESGIPIKVMTTTKVGAGVDTPECLRRVKKEIIKRYTRESIGVVDSQPEEYEKKLVAHM